MQKVNNLRVLIKKKRIYESFFFSKIRKETVLEYTVKSDEQFNDPLMPAFLFS